MNQGKVWIGTPIVRIMNEIEEELKTFQWAYPDRGDNRGEVQVNHEEQKLVLIVWCRDNDDPDSDEIKPLIVTMPITDDDPQDQIRAIIHGYLCHEADEQMWFGEERPFYPH